MCFERDASERKEVEEQKSRMCAPKRCGGQLRVQGTAREWHSWLDSTTAGWTGGHEKRTCVCGRCRANHAAARPR